MAEIVSRDFYQPDGVTQFIGLGIDNFVGIVDSTTVLKYPKTPGDKSALSILSLEAEILATIGPHRYIVGCKGLRKDGLLLERAFHGSIAQFMNNHAVTDEQRLIWARQAAEAVAVTHNAFVIHCDININNILLDYELNIRLCDFQGLLLNTNGDVNKYGLAKEGVKSFMPRKNNDFADRKTDIFALGSALYHIMQGHEPFPELSSSNDEEEIQRRFIACEYPQCRLINDTIHKCWSGKFDTAEALLLDLAASTENEANDRFKE